jgi:hypothetical protein
MKIITLLLNLETFARIFNMIIFLPRNSEQYDRVVDKLASASGADKETVSSVFSQIVRYLPKDRTWVTKRHVVNSIKKTLANGVADKKMQDIQLDYLVKEFRKDPSNPQVIKALQQRADAGLQAAKDALANPNGLTVVDNKA